MVQVSEAKWSGVAQWLDCATNDREIAVSNPKRFPLGNFGNFLYPICQCLLEETLARGGKRSHTG